MLDRLTKLGGVEVQSGRWMVNVDATIGDMFAEFDGLMPTSFDDRLLVSLVSTPPKMTNASEAVKNWLSANFSR